MGDYATPVCMQLARFARMAPVKIAEAVAKHLRRPEFLGAVEVVPPGFINFRLDPAWVAAQVEEILAAGEGYGRSDLGAGQRVQVEFVSANPTGPLHIGAARNAVLGDAIASLLDATGHEVQREYYVNDAGSRMQAFHRTLSPATPRRWASTSRCRRRLPGPVHGELGAQIAAERGRAFLEMPTSLPAIGALKASSRGGGRQGDRRSWTSVRSLVLEQSLYDDPSSPASAILRGGHVDVHDGAVWFAATGLGGARTGLAPDGTPDFISDIATTWRARPQLTGNHWGADLKTRTIHGSPYAGARAGIPSDTSSSTR